MAGPGQVPTGRPGEGLSRRDASSVTLKLGTPTQNALPSPTLAHNPRLAPSHLGQPPPWRLR